MGKTNKLAFNVAFCGIVTALATVFLFLSIIPSFAYVVPAFAGMVIWTVTRHMSAKWAYMCYAAASLLALMLIPEPEANLFFIFFFGYYPTLCNVLEKIKNQVLQFIVKLAIFNVAVVIAYQLLVFLISAEEMLEGMEFLGELAVYVFWAAGNVAFIIYDLCMKTIKQAYIKVIQPKISAKLK